MTTPAQPQMPTAEPVRSKGEGASRRPALLLAAAAGLCWAGSLTLLALGAVGPLQPITAPERLIFSVLALGAGLLTFVPIQRQLQVPGLALEGTAGTFLLLYTLTFVPAPTGWLLSPPDAPVYALLAAATFWCVSALATWPAHAAGPRIFRQRARQYDLRRARRQAHEIGALAALCIGLAGLRVLTLFGVGLLILILIVTELLFLSFVETET
ncbi:MAG: hypothetical protein RLZZ387_4382 [Chloroflexota bacterium]